MASFRTSTTMPEHPAVMEREQGCTCADEIVAMNNRGDYVGHESSCPRHWQLVDETSAWEDDDDA